MIFSLYFIYNTINGKLYVGATNNLKERIAQHKNNGKHNNKNYYIYNAMKKHGIENFQFKEVEQLSSYKELLKREVEWISLLKKSNYSLYNMTFGGEGVTGINKKGNRNPNFGKPMKQHVKDILYPFIHRKGKDNPLFGTKRPKEVMEKALKTKQPLSDSDLKSIRDEYNSGNFSQTELAEKYKISVNMCHAIVRNKIYAGVGDDKVVVVRKPQLKKETVLEIRELYSSGNYTQKELSEKFNIGMSQMNNIICKRQWKNI